jgi:hypothetical protein
MTMPPPSLEEFIDAPIEQIVRVAPATVIFAPGGTRRAAALAGIDPHSEEYVSWSRARMIACIARFFDLGVRNLFVTALQSAQLAEVGRYRERIIDWIEQGLSGPETLADYASYGWRARLVGVNSLPELHRTAVRLLEATPQRAKHTVWWYASTTPDGYWSEVLAAASHVQATTQEALIRALYGEEIAPATLLVSFGKPIVAADIMPLALAGDMQSYWTQIPGFGVDDQTLRRILYDYTYTRRTWRADKATRYVALDQQRQLWERGDVIGLGLQSHGFWYPLQSGIDASSNTFFEGEEP